MADLSILVSNNNNMLTLPPSCVEPLPFSFFFCFLFFFPVFTSLKTNSKEKERMGWDDEWVVNPKTGRQIKVGGPTWKKVFGSSSSHSSSNGKGRSSSPQRYTVAEKEAGKGLRVGKPPSLEASLDQERKLAEGGRGRQRTHLIRRAHELIKKKGDPRGKLTRGWAIDKPLPGAERRQLYDSCGQACFLAKPTTSTKKGAGAEILKIGFPICPRCSPSGKCSCEIDPRGVQSAYQRARQYGHTEVANKALSLKHQLSIPPPPPRPSSRKNKQGFS